MLQTKCYRDAAPLDGLKISVMRFTPKRFNYDILMLGLAPKPELLRSYRSGKISWKQYEGMFLKQIAQSSEIDCLIQLALEQDVTIYCSEKETDKCHRRLIAEEVMKKAPYLKVYMK